MRVPLSSSLPILVALAACGGAKPDAKSASTANKEEKHESIAELAAAQGGISALGGAGNREEGGSGTEVAFAGPLRAETVSQKKPPKLDGVLGEWHARSPVKDSVSGKTEDLGLDVAVQVNDSVLWLAAEVVDPKLTRSGKFGDKEDHLTFTIAFPSGKGQLKAYEIGVWPGVPGTAPGVVKWTAGPNAGQKVAGAKVVENDVKGGVTLEANMPWSSFPEAVRVGMRAAFRWHDGDGNAVNGVLGTAGGSVDKPSDLPALPIAAEAAVVDGLLEQKGLAGTKPKVDVFVDVAGDDRKERVSVFGRFFTICGPGYRKGRQFFWREVQGEIVSLETAPATGRGKDDLVVRRRLSVGSTTHDVLEVWTFAANGEEPQTVFSHEIAIASSDGKRRVSNATRVSNKEIEIATEPAVGWDAASFGERVAGDVEPVLLPWGTVKSQTFKLEGGRFTKASEVAQAPAASGGAPAKPEGAPAPAIAKDASTPAIRQSTDLGRAVMDAFRKDAGVAATAKPRFDIEVDMGGDTKPERVAVFGREIVILGPGIRGGSGYSRLSLTQFADEKDITELTAKDVTGNGAADIIVRGQRHVKGPSGESVDIDGLFIYEVKGDSIRRIFAIETGREMAGKRVQGQVQFVPAKAGKAFDIDVRPGVAKGFTKENYPWAQEKPGGALEPLLLPWGGIPGVRYSWDGSAYVSK